MSLLDRPALWVSVAYSRRVLLTLSVFTPVCHAPPCQRPPPAPAAFVAPDRKQHFSAVVVRVVVGVVVGFSLKKKQALFL